MRKEQLLSEQLIKIFPVVYQDLDFICTRGLNDPNMVHVYSNEEEVKKYGSYSIIDKEDKWKFSCMPDNSYSTFRTIRKDEFESEKDIHKFMRCTVRSAYEFY